MRLLKLYTSLSKYAPAVSGIGHMNEIATKQAAACVHVDLPLKLHFLEVIFTSERSILPCKYCIWKNGT